jgi:hypothetical protein
MKLSDPIMAVITRLRRVNKSALLIGAAILVLGLAFVLDKTARAQQTYTGQWLIEAKPGAEKVNLSLRYHVARNKPDDNSGFNSNTTYDIALAQLSGLTSAQVMSASGGHVEFQLRRDPGDLNFEGWFKDGHGAGHFVFVPNANFSSELTKRGFAAPSAEQQFMLAVHGVDLAYVDELRQQGYQQPTLDELVRLGTHGVRLEYVRELRTLGYEVKNADLLIRMVDHGVNLRYVRNLAALGYEKVSPEELIRSADHGVNTDFIKNLETAGYPRVSLDQLV